MSKKPHTKTKFSSTLSRIVEWLNNRWFIKTICLVLPAMWIYIGINIYGKKLSLSDDYGKTTSAGNLSIIIVYVLFLIFSFVTECVAHKNAQEKKDKMKSAEFKLGLYKSILDNQCTSDKAMLDSITAATLKKDHLTREVKTFIDESISPSLRLNDTMESIRACIVKAVNKYNNNNFIENNNDIYISLAIKEGEDKWKWFDHKNINTIHDLSWLEKQYSTFSTVLRETERNYIYFNDKIEGNLNGKYQFDDLDKEKHNIGSIICWHIIIRNPSGVFIKAVLNISTYGHQLVQASNKQSIEYLYEDIIRDDILSHFESELKTLLALRYIENKSIAVT